MLTIFAILFNYSLINSSPNSTGRSQAYQSSHPLLATLAHVSLRTKIKLLALNIRYKRNGRTFSNTPTNKNKIQQYHLLQTYDVMYMTVKCLLSTCLLTPSTTSVIASVPCIRHGSLPGLSRTMETANNGKQLGSNKEQKIMNSEHKRCLPSTDGSHDITMLVEIYDDVYLIRSN